MVFFREGDKNFPHLPHTQLKTPVSDNGVRAKIRVEGQDYQEANSILAQRLSAYPLN